MNTASWGDGMEYSEVRPMDIGVQRQIRDTPNNSQRYSLESKQKGKTVCAFKGGFLEQLVYTKFYPDAKREEKRHMHFP